MLEGVKRTGPVVLDVNNSPLTGGSHMNESDRYKCRTCGVETVAATVSFGRKLRPAESGKGGFRFAGFPVELRVCPSCGRLEMFAQDLDEFS